jgi:hypothetical protein
LRLSEDRISHISHLILDRIWKDDLVDFVDENRALKEVKMVITGYFQIEDDVDEAVRNKIRSLSRYVPEGSREWDILYKKYYQEELDKKNF